MTDDGQLLTTKEVAAILKVTTKTIERFRADGKFPFVKLGPKTIRYALAEIEEFVNSRQQRKSPRAKTQAPTE